jgi:pyridoxal phosphate enzyme (YggS family)
MSQTSPQRRAELETNLRSVRERISAACRAAGRQPDEVTLVAVTKTFPASDVVALAQLGLTEIGENRDQEAAPKAAAVAAAGAHVHWHFVGQLQRNKSRSVVTYADLVHSVDGVRLTEALARAAGQHRDTPLDVLVQVGLDGDPDRGGAVPQTEYPERVETDRDLDRVLAAVAHHDELRLRGLMAVAPLDWEPDRAFDTLARIASRVRRAYPSADLLSAGMSGDIESAIDHGATHVRIGTALLSNRAPLR